MTWPDVISGVLTGCGEDVSDDAMASYVRAAALRGFDDLVRDLGGDPEDLLHRAQIDPAVLGDDDALLSTGRFGACLRLAATDVGRPDLGLLLAGRQDIGVVGPLAVCVESAPTIGEALACADRYLFVHASGASLRQAADPRGEAGVVAIDFVPADPTVGVEMGLGLIHRVATMVCGGDYGLRGVHLPGPPVTAEAVYQDFFGAPVRFRTGESLLRVPERLLERELGTGNAVLHRMAIEYLEAHRRDEAATLAGRVSGVVSRSLGSAPPLVGSVAGVLGMHPRTLQRRLAEEGTSYERILDEVRRETAYRLITTTELPFGRVCALVGLSEQAVLTRASHRWFGASPREVRRSGASSMASAATAGASAVVSPSGAAATVSSE